MIIMNAKNMYKEKIPFNKIKNRPIIINAIIVIPY